ncbi:MAG: hypothetical protein ACHQPI_02880 [Thermoanaerobaculia bacterium]
MPAEDIRDLLEQIEAGRAELLAVAVQIARRLRTVDPEAAEEVAQEVQTHRAGLAESSLLEATVTADVLGLVVDALRGREG